LSRNARFRGALLSALYAVVFVLEPWSILVLALFGLVESVFNLRARRARRLSMKIQPKIQPKI
jgi:F0F1-type ATP synthase assembly protein I